MFGWVLNTHLRLINLGLVKWRSLDQQSPIHLVLKDRSSRPEAFLREGVVKICSKFTGEHPCRSAISV